MGNSFTNEKSYHAHYDGHVHRWHLVDAAAVAVDDAAAAAAAAVAVAVADTAVVDVEAAVGIVVAAVVWHAAGIVDIEHFVADIAAVGAVETVDIVSHDPTNKINNSSSFSTLIREE